MATMYYQTSGKLADASHKIQGACKAGDYATCQRIWKETTGKDTLPHNLNNYTWWMFAATEQLVLHSQPTNEGTWERILNYY